MTMTHSDAPVLVELTRGELVECRHRGHVAIAKLDGTVLALGDVSSPVFPRSAIKALQCVPVITSGAAERFGLTQREIAFCCASHSGTPAHAEAALGILGKIGLDEDDLVCGPHLPLGEDTAHAMLRANGEPGRRHNNCSGKHSGMLATAMHLGEPAKDYHLPDHPVQRRIRDSLSSMTGLALAGDVWGTDGCSVPNYAMPLDVLARAFAGFVDESGASDQVNAAAAQIKAACWAHPDMVAGPGRLDTLLMSRFPGEVFIKTGAEGVYCGAVRSLGIGFALKIEDGAKRGAEAAVSEILAALLRDAADLGGVQPIRNWAGTVVGEARPSAVFADALATLPTA